MALNFNDFDAILTPHEYANIEMKLETSSPLDYLCVRTVLEYLGDGLCSWCQREPTAGYTSLCSDCHTTFQAIESDNADDIKSA